jgi:hypothetical protein
MLPLQQLLLLRAAHAIQHSLSPLLLLLLLAAAASLSVLLVTCCTSRPQHVPTRPVRPGKRVRQQPRALAAHRPCSCRRQRWTCCCCCCCKLAELLLVC